MWIVSPFGFYSIIKDEMGYHIRSRRRKDYDYAMKALEPRFVKSVIVDNNYLGRDYQYHIIVEFDGLEYFLNYMAHSVDYSNVKNCIAQKQGQEYASIARDIYNSLTLFEERQLPPMTSDSRPSYMGFSSPVNEVEKI